MDLTQALNISSAGMDAQTQRLRVIAENLANQDSTGSTPGATPYRRREVVFQNMMDRTLGAPTVRVKAVVPDNSAFPQKYDPSNPAADTKGYVSMPNVNSFTEMMDMREAERSYSANLNVMQASRSMLTRVIDLLK
ncbi:MAG TPA: flagellar basal body rod protein FlgC [Acetobacteraceae bacterium]|nr:flagellar basal body rod protein FlgC [Acetobacteraceae bacterium]